MIRKITLAAIFGLVVGCGESANSVKGYIVAYQPCDDQGCSMVVGDIYDEDAEEIAIFIPASVLPTVEAKKYNWYNVEGDYSHINGDETYVVSKVLEKKSF